VTVAEYQISPERSSVLDRHPEGAGVGGWAGNVESTC
jgi:hypothetical protein